MIIVSTSKGDFSFQSEDEVLEFIQTTERRTMKYGLVGKTHTLV